MLIILFKLERPKNPNTETKNHLTKKLISNLIYD